jgi:two-component system chemotaxis response regulator CheB
LPADLSAAVLIVLHLPPDAPSALAEILDRAGPLPAARAVHDAPLRRGRVYVAPPNRHLVVGRGHLRLVVGPRENGVRPSVDTLFRSAARAYGQRVVGVVLTGTLSDGALGLAAIKLRDGTTMVQDPDEALFSGMPNKALSVGRVDYCLPVAQIAQKIVELSQHPMGGAQHMDTSTDADSTQPTVHAADEPGDRASPKLANHASGLTCPECHGSLWELTADGETRFECRVGHAYGVEALVAEQGEAVEAALWASINSLQERAATFRKLVDASTVGRRGDTFRDRAEQTERHASVVFDLLRRLVAEGDIG